MMGREGITVQRLLRYLGAIGLAMVIAGQARAGNYVPGEILVELDSKASIASINSKYGTTTVFASSYSPTYCLDAGSDANRVIVMAKMKKDRDILAYSANLCNEALSSGPFKEPSVQWVYDAHGVGLSQAAGADAYANQPAISAVDFGLVSQQYDGSGATVAILDTGISLRNSTLAAHVLGGLNFLDGSTNTDDVPAGIDSDLNGIFDQAAGHGTMVAGIVNRFAPNAKLLPVKVLDSDGGGSLWNVIEGIHYAVSQGVDVINCSFGSTIKSAVLEQAIDDAEAHQILVVTSAGNGGTDTVLYPAGYSDTIAVAALNDDNTKADFSSYGGDVDLDAPGVGIVSVYWTGDYASWSGTSFSAPMIAAEAALIRSAKSMISLKRMRSRMMRTAISVDPLNPLFQDQLGRGIIDMDAALLKL